MTTAVKEVKKDEFEIIEDHLDKYTDYKIGVENLQEQLNYMYPKVTASYDPTKEGSSGTFMFSSQTEDIAIERVERGKEIKKEIEKYELLIACIERALEGLDAKERQYVKLHYFEKLDNRALCDRMNFSLKMMYKTRDSFKEKALIRLRNLLLVDI